MQNYFNPMLSDNIDLPFLVKCIGGLKSQGTICRPQGFDDYQWIHCIKGCGRLIIDQKEFILTPNTGIFISRSIPHEYYAVEAPWKTHFIAFSGYGVQPLLDTLGLKDYGVFSFNDLRYLDNILNDIYMIAKNENIAANYKCSAALYSLLIEVKNNIRENSTNVENSRYLRIKPVIEYIELNFHNDISINDLAQNIDVSPQYLCRLFNIAFNMRPFAYLTKFRIKKAKEFLLNHKDYLVSDICKYTGFNDQSYFCAVFKKHEGVSPLEYRNMYSST